MQQKFTPIDPAICKREICCFLECFEVQQVIDIMLSSEGHHRRFPFFVNSYDLFFYKPEIATLVIHFPKQMLPLFNDAGDRYSISCFDVLL